MRVGICLRGDATGGASVATEQQGSTSSSAAACAPPVAAAAAAAGVSLGSERGCRLDGKKGRQPTRLHHSTANDNNNNSSSAIAASCGSITPLLRGASPCVRKMRLNRRMQLTRSQRKGDLVPSVRILFCCQRHVISRRRTPCGPCMMMMLHMGPCQRDHAAADMAS